MACFAVDPKILVAVAVALLLGSCSARTYAPVREQGAPVHQPDSRYREVRAGDTLYSIAWDSGRDVRELAAWNDIDPPYLIKPGQRLRLYPPTATSDPPGRAKYHTVAKGESLYRIARAYDVATRDLAAWNSITPPYTIRPGQKLRVAPAQRSAKAGLVTSSTAAASTKANVARSKPDADPLDRQGTIAWIWPTDGALVGRFTAGGQNKGVDIAGNIGQPIHAAAPGRVVYQGSGLRGYGQLIIVKHNAEFLSAYAHCSAIYVREGSVIKPGQKIAEMGSTGTDRAKLHFEIRRRGVPVDPLEFLPKR